MYNKDYVQFDDDDFNFEVEDGKVIMHDDNSSEGNQNEAKNVEIISKYKKPIANIRLVENIESIRTKVDNKVEIENNPITDKVKNIENEKAVEPEDGYKKAQVDDIENKKAAEPENSNKKDTVDNIENKKAAEPENSNKKDTVDNIENKKATEPEDGSVKAQVRNIENQKAAEIENVHMEDKASNIENQKATEPENSNKKDKADDIENKKAAKKLKQTNKNKKNSQDKEVEEPIEKRDMNLYIVTDSRKSGLAAYFKSVGLNIVGISNSLEEAKGYLLMNSEPTRVVIIDSGTGKFISTVAREEIIDMLGTTEDNTKFTVFYTDSVLRSDAVYSLGEVSKQIEWIPYKSSLITAAVMLSHNENYINVGIKNSDEAVSLGFKGLEISYNENFDTTKPSLINSEIASKMAEDSSSDLIGFEPHI